MHGWNSWTEHVDALDHFLTQTVLMGKTNCFSEFVVFCGCPTEPFFVWVTGDSKEQVLVHFERQQFTVHRDHPLLLTQYLATKVKILASHVVVQSRSVGNPKKVGARPLLNSKHWFWQTNCFRGRDFTVALHGNDLFLISASGTEGNHCSTSSWHCSGSGGFGHIWPTAMCQTAAPL